MANTDWLGVTNTILNTVVPFAQGSAQKAAGQFEAQQHYFNAQRRLRAGEQEAMGHRARGRRIASDAKTAMVAQGGTVDSAMLARIKREAEMDAIAAMFDAKADADTSRFAGQAAAQQGKNLYRAGVIKAGANLVDGASTLYKNRKPEIKRNTTMDYGYNSPPMGYSVNKGSNTWSHPVGRQGGYTRPKRTPL